MPESSVGFRLGTPAQHRQYFPKCEVDTRRSGITESTAVILDGFFPKVPPDVSASKKKRLAAPQAQRTKADPNPISTTLTAATLDCISFFGRI